MKPFLFILCLVLISGCGDDQSGNSGLSGGTVLIAPLNSTQTLLVDEAGNTVHSWQSVYQPGLAAYMQQDGSLYRAGNLNNASFADAGGKGGIIERISWDGAVDWQYTVSSETNLQHHDIEILPNGNLLILVWVKISEEDALGAGRDSDKYDAVNGLWSDEIWEINPATDTVVWKWRVWDHLTTETNNNYSKIGINSVGTGPDALYDWTHMNSIDYNAALDQVLVSVKNFNEVWIIDHNTTTAEAAGSAGDLLYRFGNPSAYGGTGSQILYGQHDAEWLDDERVILFNNGNPVTRKYSTVDLYTLPVNNGSYTTGAAPVAGWCYSSSDLYSASVSGVAVLEDGYLITEGVEGRIFAVDTQGSVFWQYNASGSVFKSEYYSAVYLTNK